MIDRLFDWLITWDFTSPITWAAHPSSPTTSYRHQFAKYQFWEKGHIFVPPPPPPNPRKYANPIFCTSLFFSRTTPAVLQLMEFHLLTDESDVWSHNGITALPWYRDEGSLTFSLSLKVDSQFVHSCSIHRCLDPQFIHFLLKAQSVVVKHTQQSVHFLLPVHLCDTLLSIRCSTCPVNLTCSTHVTHSKSMLNYL